MTLPVLIRDAMVHLKQKKGASLAQIRKHLECNYEEKLNATDKRILSSALKGLVQKGKIQKSGLVYKLSRKTQDDNDMDMPGRRRRRHGRRRALTSKRYCKTHHRKQKKRHHGRRRRRRSSRRRHHRRRRHHKRRRSKRRHHRRRRSHNRRRHHRRRLHHRRRRSRHHRRRPIMPVPGAAGMNTASVK